MSYITRQLVKITWTKRNTLMTNSTYEQENTIEHNYIPEFQWSILEKRSYNARPAILLGPSAIHIWCANSTCCFLQNECFSESLRLSECFYEPYDFLEDGSLMTFEEKHLDVHSHYYQHTSDMCKPAWKISDPSIKERFF